MRKKNRERNGIEIFLVSRIFSAEQPCPLTPSQQSMENVYGITNLWLL